MNRIAVLEEMLETLHIISKHIGPAKIGTGEQPHCPVSRPQIQIMYALAHHGKISVSNIANRMGITPGAVTQFIDVLIDQGWVVKEKSETDKRTVYIAFSDGGKERFESIKKEHLARLLPLFEALSDEELQTMVSLQKKIIHNMLDKNLYV